MCLIIDDIGWVGIPVSVIGIIKPVQQSCRYLSAEGSVITDVWFWVEGFLSTRFAEKNKMVNTAMNVYFTFIKQVFV